MSERRRPHNGPSTLCGVQPKRLGTKEAEMKIVGCDLHARQQSIAMLDMATGEFTEKIIRHEGKAVREFYAALEGPVVVGIEATGSMQWFLELLEELGIKYRVGHPPHTSNSRSRSEDSPLDVETPIGPTYVCQTYASNQALSANQ